ncbi:Ldh family oxidoreductase [Bosea sp. (in: a-proteobacteria)]|uniref:Ldh family oxidoreductase n=1 Tax=Bosea sp. (in: a-proteobacteria) TaxID=1871050 RepID=UPI002606493A|nr:Ldh family oxidoreductase [Bosea sp. (in: a-proteobacteria)]MCO5089585.1 Ldh family oxidoreductase [Bosea sp. (in: a-proteobacteria)]
MKLKIEDARTLAVEALMGIGIDEKGARVTADHLVDAAKRGMTFGGLPRILAISERLNEYGDRRRPIATVHETPVSALIDGGDNVGYIVAAHTTQLAIEKARQSGIAIVGANNTYYTGLFAYYVEMATKAGFVSFCIGNGNAMVAPEGAAEARLGTNPIAFGFPSQGDPVIWDIGTAAIMQGELMLHMRVGEEIPEGLALDKQGLPTRDPVAALAGAIKTWGGHRGSGLSVVVQMLGALCGGPVISPGICEMAFLIVVIDPKVLMPGGEYPARVTELADAIRSARPLEGAPPVRMPFDGSARIRRESEQNGSVEIPDVVHASLLKLAGQRKSM